MMDRESLISSATSAATGAVTGRGRRGGVALKIATSAVVIIRCVAVTSLILVAATFKYRAAVGWFGINKILPNTYRLFCYRCVA